MAEIDLGADGVNIGIDMPNLFGSGRTDAREEHRKALAREMRQRNAERRTMYHQMVVGAKKAGLHPLFAMGGGASVGGSGAIQVGSRTPGIAGSYSSKRISPAEQAAIDLTQAQTAYWRARTAEINDARFGYEDSKTARHRQNANAAQDGGAGQFEIVPSRVESWRRDDRTTKAGPARAPWNLVQLGDPKKWPPIYMQGDTLGENFEDPVSAQAFWEKNHSRLTMPLLRYIADKTPGGMLNRGIAWIAQKLQGRKKHKYPSIRGDHP